jgi:hypothetical protein
MSERTGQFDPAKTPGAVGEAPPPGAPREVAMPLQPGLIAQQLAKAQANERALKPLVFDTNAAAATPAAGAPGLGAGGGGKTAWQHQPAALPAGGQPTGNVMPAARSAVQGRPPVTIPAKTAGEPLIVLTDAQQVPVVEAAGEPEVAPPAAIRPRVEGQFADVARNVLDSRPRLARPAESNSDSPARGVPRGTTDPGKQITGGFGDAAQAQYFPLDGTELRELVLSMMDRLAEQLQNDLRFSIAAVYPRVAVQLDLRVDGFVEDIGFGITKVLPPHEKTPLDVARSMADQGVFVVSVTRAEMSADGESLAPPNAIREELGLAVPHKRAIDVPGGRMIVDVVNGAAGSGR